MNPVSARHSFRTTRWSVVRQALSEDAIAARQAMAALCDGYWYPVYAFIRRSGKGPHDAEDLTQDFFGRLIEKSILASADPARGRLRTFLLACVRHFLADAHDRSSAKKRGAGMTISFDAVEAEERYSADPRDDLTPDRLFQRRWALALLAETLRALGDEWASSGKANLFAALRPFLGFDVGAVKSYEEISREVGIPIGTLKNHVFRMRERWRDLLLERVAETLDNPTPEAIKGELSELLTCV